MAFSFFKKAPPGKPEPSSATSAVRKPQAGTQGDAPASISPTSSGGVISLDFVSRDPLNGARKEGGGELEVSDVCADIHPSVEEAAMLFANGDDAAALEELQRALEAPDAGASQAQIWAMLFDMCLALGRREDFERHSIVYATRFEQSAPSWPDDTPVRKLIGGPPTLTLSGKLCAASRPALEQVERMGVKQPTLRVDLARVQDADEEAAAVLLSALAHIRRLGHIVSLLNTAQLAAALAPRVQPGQATHQSTWLLHLELLQQLGQFDAFEETALQFAITFEISPPSWEARWVADAVTASEQPCSTTIEAPPSGCALSGEIVGAKQDAFAAIAAALPEHGHLKVDCSQLRRMDFVSAGLLFNVITAAQAGGRQIRLMQVRPMVAALFLLIGIAHVAEIVQQRL